MYLFRASKSNGSALVFDYFAMGACWVDNGHRARHEGMQQEMRQGAAFGCCSRHSPPAEHPDFPFWLVHRIPRIMAYSGRDRAIARRGTRRIHVTLPVFAVIRDRSLLPRFVERWRCTYTAAGALYAEDNRGLAGNLRRQRRI